MHTTYPQLRSDVQLIRGMDDHHLLFDATTGKYHRLGPASARIVEAMDGSRNINSLAQLISGGKNPAGNGSFDQVNSFIQQLSGAKLLEGNEPTESRNKRFKFSPLLPRFIVYRNFSRIVSPVSSFVGHIPPKLFGSVALIGSLAGYTWGFGFLFSQTNIFAIRSIEVYLISLFLMLVGILIHETWHAIVSGIHSQPVRGLGIALFVWVFPIAFVDRTDAYRIKSRLSRTAIALAGPISDGWIAGLTGLVAFNSTGKVQEVFILLLLFQFALLIANFNPLTHSDGVDAVEAASGLVDIRGRSFSVVRSVFKLKPLPQYLERISNKLKIAYFAYGILCLIFSGLVILFVFFNLISMLFFAAR